VSQEANYTPPPLLGDKMASLVLRHRFAIVLAWVIAAIVAKLFAPNWNSIAYDGDFEYLPAGMTSVAGDRLLDQAFPAQRSRSQIVLVVSRDATPLDTADEVVSLDLLRRLYHRMAEVTLLNSGLQSDAREFLDETIRIDQLYFDTLTELRKETDVARSQLRLAIAFWDRAKLLEQLGETDLAASDMEAALVLEPDLTASVKPVSERELGAWSSLIELRSWKDAIIGSRMSKPEARLAILLSDAELAATSNINFLDAVHVLTDSVLAEHRLIVRPGLEILATGSAAIGGETLTAARDAIRYTELLTVIMIFIILGLIYRAPLLVAIPMISIAIAVTVSSGLVAWLTLASRWAESPWLDVQIFTTSRIFVVVILFGAGTDFCLFLISRLREEAAQWTWDRACHRSLSGVSGALAGSALTTVVGLAMLWIADFGKFSYTGPVIALCLTIGLLVCLTFTPALLSLIGPKAFWPSAIHVDGMSSIAIGTREGLRPTGLWGLIALKLTRYPVLAMVLGLVALCPPAILGYLTEDEVTYDISSQLDDSAQSRRGLRMLDRYFDVGEVNPTTVLITLPKDSTLKQLKTDSVSLSHALYSLPGVIAVRSADDPLGDFPPDRTMSLLSKDAWRRRALKTHRIARNYFFSEVPAYENRLIRLDVVLDGDPFDIKTADNVTGIREWLEGQTREAGSPWHDASILLTGTTPSIIDLRTVTLSDNRRIKVAVVIAVFCALWLVIRRVSLCLYLIATVLLSYYATFGLTILFFRVAYGSDYVGLDWKLPLFLFVILVAVGQDYNVYLVTRILEEQRERGGWLSALRRAVARTGGIITACGLVMAATFFSMTASAWLPMLASLVGLSNDEQAPSLRGIVELGFALGLGVLIDTFYVRTILVPSFVAVLDRVRNGPRLPSFPDESDHGG